MNLLRSLTLTKETHLSANSLSEGSYTIQLPLLSYQASILGFWKSHLNPFMDEDLKGQEEMLSFSDLLYSIPDIKVFPFLLPEKARGEFNSTTRGSYYLTHCYRLKMKRKKKKKEKNKMVST